MEGKAAFITGGASGIGAAAARKFSQMGCAIVIADVDATKVFTLV